MLASPVCSARNVGKESTGEQAIVFPNCSQKGTSLASPRNNDRRQNARNTASLYCVVIPGIMHRFGPDKKAADRIFHKLIARPLEEPQRLGALLVQLYWGIRHRTAPCTAESNPLLPRPSRGPPSGPRQRPMPSQEQPAASLSCTVVLCPHCARKRTHRVTWW